MIDKEQEISESEQFLLRWREKRNKDKGEEITISSEIQLWEPCEQCGKEPCNENFLCEDCAR